MEKIERVKGSIQTTINPDAARLTVEFTFKTGETRPVSSLSGGETFPASFSLALALSSFVQQRKTKPLEFFFIDEGFGTLDQETLSRVADLMERLREENKLVGFITHRRELQEFVHSKIMVSRNKGNWSKIRIIS